MGGYSTVDPQYTGVSNPDEADQDDLQRAIAKVMSPQSAQSLVPPPPNTPPASDTAQSTPRTGSLDYAPTQAQPKVSGPPMLPGIATPPEKLGTVSPVQPASNNTSSGGLRTVVRDLNGNPAGSPLAALAGSRSGFGAQGTQQASAVQPAVGPLTPAGMGTSSASSVQPVRRAQSGVQPVIPPGQVQPVQPSVQPYRPGMPLAAQQAQRLQAYNAGPAPAQYAARMSPVATDPGNPDPNASLRPGGSGVVAPMPLSPPSTTQVNAPSQLDRDQARLQYLQNSGSGISQIKNPVGKVAATAGDIALRMFAPGLEPFIGGTEGHHQMLVNQQLGVVGGDQSQLQAAAQLQDTQSQIAERQALADKADRWDPTKTVTTADGVFQLNPQTGKFDSKIGDAPDKLNKYQVVTAGDGSMFRIDPSNPTSAEPITGPDGKQLTGKTESKYVQLEGADGKPHTVEVDSKGNTIKDLGATGEKPTAIKVGNEGTWALDEDKDGKPILFNSKTGETKEAPNVQKAGTAAKNQAAQDKMNEPIDGAIGYADDYLKRPPTGAGDEALMEKYFELAKPSSGFRMTQNQTDMLNHAQSLMTGIEAKGRHLLTGSYYTPQQRKEIVDTMHSLAAAKKSAMARSGSAPPPAATAPAKAGGFDWNAHPKVNP